VFMLTRRAAAVAEMRPTLLFKLEYNAARRNRCLFATTAIMRATEPFCRSGSSLSIGALHAACKV
jgi:hypothetical protein